MNLTNFYLSEMVLSVMSLLIMLKCLPEVVLSVLAVNSGFWIRTT